MASKIRASMKNTTRPLLLAVACALSWGTALAEKADRNKPMNIEADALRYDDLKQVSVFTGRVVMTKGTIIIRGARVEVRQDAEGYQFGTVTAEPGKLAYYKQKREGLDEYIEGEADSIEYDGRADRVRFIRNAELRRLRGATVADEMTGSLIVYDSDGLASRHGLTPLLNREVTHTAAVSLLAGVNLHHDLPRIEGCWDLCLRKALEHHGGQLQVRLVLPDFVPLPLRLRKAVLTPLTYNYQHKEIRFVRDFDLRMARESHRKLEEIPGWWDDERIIGTPLLERVKDRSQPARAALNRLKKRPDSVSTDGLFQLGEEQVGAEARRQLLVVAAHPGFAVDEDERNRHLAGLVLELVEDR